MATFKTFKELLADPNVPFRTSNFIGGPAYFNLEKFGAITSAPREIIEAFRRPNIKGEVPVGVVGYKRKEGTVFTIDGAYPTPTYAQHGQYIAKQSHKNRTFAVPTPEQEYLAGTDPLAVQMEAYADHVDYEVYEEVLGLCEGMTKNTAFVVGDENTNFSRSLMLKVAKSLKTHSRPAVMMMSHDILADILEKQEAGTIKSNLITVMNTMPTTVTTVDATNRYTGAVNASTGLKKGLFDFTPFWYEGSVPVFTIDEIPDNFIYVLYENAFVLGYAPTLTKSIFTDYKAHTGEGELNIKLGIRKVLYPNGLSWVGVKTTNYANVHGVTYAELKKGGLYDVPSHGDASDMGFRAIKVKKG